MYINYALQRKEEVFSFNTNNLKSEIKTLLPKIFGHCHNRDLTRLCNARPAFGVLKWPILWFVKEKMVMLNILSFIEFLVLFSK